MFEDLKKNIEQEKKILIDLRSIETGINTDPSHRQFYQSSFNSLLNQLKMLNKATPDLLKESSPLKKPEPRTIQKKEKPKTVKMSYVSPATKEKKFVTINEADKKEFLKKLRLSENAITKIKKTEEKKEKDIFRKPSAYARISNRYFRKISEGLAPKFSGLSKDLKKANISFLTPTYLSMAMMSVLLSFIASILIFIGIVLISPASWIFFWGVILIPALTAAAFYFYPSSEAGSVQKKISQELPFATIHMAAIAGSDVEPTKIFRIIALSKEYPAIGKEMRKIIAQVEIYGYDLVTSLKNAALRTSNKKLAELMTGFATNISTGGSLKNYLEKKSENLLLDYKLERQRYSDLAGTFMDIYISILIAAPLVLMMMFIIMNVAGLGLGGLSITALLFISVAAVVVINIIFLVVLNLKQPKV